VPVRRSVLAPLLGAVACYGVLAVTEPPGPGLDPDSMSYLGSAESLVRHGTLRIPAAHWTDADSTSPLGHFPPGFPLAIAVPLALGAPPAQAARGVEAVAAFATVALVVGLVASASGIGAGAVAGAVLLATTALATDHLRILSEPLCLALLVATLALMVRARRPLLYGTAAAAAGLVRYAALSATAAAVLWAFGREGPVRERVRRAVLAALPTIIVQGAWVLRTHAESGSVRSLGLRDRLGPTFREGLATLGSWLAPSVPPALRVPLAIVVSIAAAALLFRAATVIRREAREGAARLVRAAGLLAGCYGALVLVSRLFVDEAIPFDDRMLSPGLLLAEIIVVTAYGAAWRSWSARVRPAAAAAVVLWLLASGRATAQAVRDGLDGGWGYASDEWRSSRVGAWLRTEGKGAAIFSNDPPGVFFLTGRPSRDVPAALDGDSVREFRRVLAAHGGVLVRFPGDWEPMAPPDSLAARLGLRKAAEDPEGAVWTLPNPSAFLPVPPPVR
jgi:hypothetical protein